MVEKICGTPQEDFLKVADMYCGGCSAPDKTGAIFYAMGQTQHTVGTQNVRSMAILQLLLGNIGMPGGGINALRGESNVQGSTDMGLLFNNLTGYLGAPNDKEPDFETYSKRFSKTSYWVERAGVLQVPDEGLVRRRRQRRQRLRLRTTSPRPAATTPGSASSRRCTPARSRAWSAWARTRPWAARTPGWSARRWRTSTGWWRWTCSRRRRPASGRAPASNPSDIQTEVFLLPAADAIEKAGSIATSGRRIQWRPKVAEAPGDAKPDIWILTQLVKALKQAYAASSDSKDLPILDLVWDYGDPPDVELVAREINGYRLRGREGFDRQGAGEEGRAHPRLRDHRQRRRPDAPSPAATGSTAATSAPADDGTGTQMPAVKRRGQKDPGDMGFYPYWGYTWPANRRILYNRASATAGRHSLGGEQEGHLVGRQRRFGDQGRPGQPDPRQVGGL